MHNTCVTQLWCTQVLAEIVEIPEGQELAALFHAVCEGAYQKEEHHNALTVVAGSAAAEGGRGGKPLTLQSSNTVYLVVRNNCDQDVTVDVSQTLALVVKIQLAVARSCACVRPPTVCLCAPPEHAAHNGFVSAPHLLLLLLLLLCCSDQLNEVDRKKHLHQWSSSVRGS
jgi:hypothetical protein